jgi:regulator of RNase E activity RraA
MWSPQRQDGSTKIVGPAYTVRYVGLGDPMPKCSSHYVSLQWHSGLGLLPHNLTSLFYCDIRLNVLIHKCALQIDSVPHGAVIFVSCPAKIPNAVYGGLMSTRAKASGAVGSVIDGRFRDLQEQRDLDYPVRGTVYCRLTSNAGAPTVGHLESVLTYLQ